MSNGNSQKQIEYEIQKCSQWSGKKDNKEQKDYKTELFHDGHSFDSNIKNSKQQFRAIQGGMGIRLKKAKRTFQKITITRSS